MHPFIKLKSLGVSLLRTLDEENDKEEIQLRKKLNGVVFKLSAKSMDHDFSGKEKKWEQEGGDKTFDQFGIFKNFRPFYEREIKSWLIRGHSRDPHHLLIYMKRAQDLTDNEEGKDPEFLLRENMQIYFQGHVLEVGIEDPKK